MKILVLTAMEVEKKTLLDSMTNVQVQSLINGSQLYSGLLDGQDFSLVESGIGKANAAMTCALAIQAHHKNLDLIINSGVAGGLLPDHKPCDIVIAENVSYYDVDVCAFGYALGQVPGQSAVYQTHAEAVKICMRICQEADYPARIGQIISGDRFVKDHKTVEELKKSFPTALALEMEGAAVAQTSYRCSIPFLVVRAISDSSDDNAKNSYQQFLDKAAEHSETIVRGFVNAEKNT